MKIGFLQISMETENKIQTRREELEGLVRESKRERLVGLAKTTGLTALPIAILGGIVGVNHLVTSPLENPDLKHLLSIGLPAVLGVAAGYFASASGIIEDYVEYFTDLVRDIRYSGQRVKQYRTKLSELE